MSLIPVHIISGFLGSGKTTFLKEIIRQTPLSVKLGIIQNEFAPANMDGREIETLHGNYRLLEINNGSVFCVCLMGDFIRSLRNFLDDYSPDLVLLEASGLSDTTSIAEVFSDPWLSERIYFAANWCIVDACNFHRSGRMIQRVIHQIIMADTILLNKTDLAEEQVDDLRQRLSEINPFAEIIPVVRCRIPFQPEKFHFREKPGGQRIPLDRPAFNSMVIRTTRMISGEGLKQFLNLWAPLSYRIKGYVITSDHAVISVQCAGSIIETKIIDFHIGPTQLIAVSDRFTLREWNASFRQFC